jgi:hypothetical protein
MRQADHHGLFPGNIADYFPLPTCSGNCAGHRPNEPHLGEVSAGYKKDRPVREMTGPIFWY